MTAKTGKPIGRPPVDSIKPQCSCCMNQYRPMSFDNDLGYVCVRCYETGRTCVEPGCDNPSVYREVQCRVHLFAESDAFHDECMRQVGQITESTCARACETKKGYSPDQYRGLSKLKKVLNESMRKNGIEDFQSTAPRGAANKRRAINARKKAGN
jgi:hypothetical protein